MVLEPDAAKRVLNMRLLVLGAALLLAIPPSAATAAALEESKVELHGYAKAGADLTLASPYPVGGKARLQTDLSGGTRIVRFRAMFDLDMDVRAAGEPEDRTAEFRVIPVECRMDLRLGPIDVVVGKQYAFWGQTDWINPTDLFTPWDYVHISSELEDYRVAPWALRTTAYVKATSFDLVWVPWPTPHVMDFSPMEAEGVTVDDPSMPRRSIGNSDIGIRVATRFLGIDASAMGFHGLDKRPGMVMTADIDTTVMPPPPPVLTATPTYGMMNAVGGDLAWGAGPILLKGEVAYYWTGDLAGDDPTVRNPELTAVTGLTVVPAPWLNFTVQGTVDHLTRYDPEAEEAALLAAGMSSVDVGPSTSWGIVERVAIDIRDIVSISLVSMQGLPEADWFGLGYVSWRAADGLTVLLGAVLFGGPDGSDFGRLGDYSRVFVEAKYSF